MKGKVITKIKGFYYVEVEGVTHECKLRGILKKNNKKDNCVTGDIVEFSDENFITKVYPRKNIIHRPLVANIDYLIIQFSALDPKFDIGRFNILLLNAFYYNIKPIAVINKVELLSVEEEVELRKSLEFLKKLEIEIFYISTYEDIGIAEVKEYIKGQITAFGGPSGSGKSSLLNLIQSGKKLEVGATSKKNSRGRHTTKGTTLLPMLEGGWVIDTPGFSSIELPPIKDVTELSNLFPEFIEYRTCKYNNCIHINEPNCGVKDQLGLGIEQARYDFYIWCYNFYKLERWNKY
ncbi:MAG: ribosome small subunit-dependent GTPase A [Psychrilyobacter sp.]|nr:ribosome small subunit-dependent GTPase A [Psychrilyobacter sp.]